MNDQNVAFSPDWISPPGETISDLLEERGWTQVELAQRMGYTTKHISLLINQYWQYWGQPRQTFHSATIRN